MKTSIKEKLIKDIHEFELNKLELSPSDAENSLIQILSPLMNSEGYQVTHTDRIRDNGIDFLAVKNSEKIGIEYKHYKSPVGAAQIRSLIGTAIINKLDKVILLTSSMFTKEAVNIASQIDPISVELLDINSLKNWVARIEANYDESEVTKVLRAFTEKIIDLINKMPRTLDQIEWRDLERVLAEVFTGIGFKTTLTPSSKDGGKDIVLECFSESSKNSFIVEIKHWRSGQKVGEKYVKDFLKVIAKEDRKGGLFLSTYGFTENAVESITEIERQKVKFGQEEKILSLCRTYMKKKSGIWQDNNDLSEILFSETN